MANWGSEAYLRGETVICPFCTMSQTFSSGTRKHDSDCLIVQARAVREARADATHAQPPVVTCTNCGKPAEVRHVVIVQGASEQWCDGCYTRWAEVVDETPAADAQPVGEVDA